MAANGSMNGFDEEFDVVVVGYGFSGATTAIEAAQTGARVLLVEKGAVPGGISICSYGAVRSADSEEKAFEYLTHTNGGRTTPQVLRVLAKGMTEQEDYVRDLAKVNGAEIATTKESGKTGANYPFPGFDTFYQTTVRTVPNFLAKAVYPWANGAPGGPMLFKILDDNLAAQRVEIRLNTKALRLITANTSKEVIGIVVESAGSEMRIRAKRGVVLACGGFEGSRHFREQFWEGNPVLPAAARNNTGDGIRMAQDLGAALWHMWHFHGAYGFKAADPEYPYAIRVKRLPDWVPNGNFGFVPRRDETGSIDATQVKMAWILLDKYGKRFMNEYQPYLQDTAHRPMHYFDPATQSYPRIPAYLICDENGRKLYPLGRPTSNDKDVHYDWSKDNLKEVESGILKRGQTIAELAQKLGLDPQATEKSIARWNEQCALANDGDFGRPNSAMVPVSAPPFYGAPVWPVVSNTQGGPIHDAEQRVLDVFGKPIPRLYAVGELGSAYGHLYMSGGNISECLISGRVAGTHVTQLPN
ncbi:MAG: FAD-dependent oxidoreductase [Hyphomicrobiales bacterium]|nr:FAD-dependent oxidoreductase [Hyphomicrobiales bacterium]